MMIPTIYFGNGNVGTVSAYPVILINYEPPRSIAAQGFRIKDAQFKVNPRNHLQIKRFFQKIYQWFDSDEYKDLFILDEHTGKLMVNMEYRNVMAKVSSSRYDSQAMLAVPTVVEFDSVQSEGCALAINNTTYTCPLTDLEVESILGILETFSFQTEAHLLTTLAINRKEFITNSYPSYGSSGAKVNW